MGKGGADYSLHDPNRSRAKWGTVVHGTLVALAGACLVGIGVYGLLNPLGASMVPITLPALAIAAGSSVVLLSLVGCFASFAEHRKLLWIYFALMAALVLLQIVVGATALAARGRTIDRLADRRWDYLYHNQPRELRRIEEQYQCCGFQFLDDRAWPKHASDRKRCANNKDLGFSRPCLDPVRDEWNHRQKVFGVVVCTLAALELLGLLPVYYLISSLPSSSQRMEELTEEHRRLIAQTGHGDHGYYGGSRSYDYDHERAGGASATPIQHSVGGPAGSYEARARPGSRTA